MRAVSRSRLRRYALCALVLIAAATGGWFLMIRMPGKSWSAPLPPMKEEEAELAVKLRRDVEHLARKIGERNVSFRYDALRRAADHIGEELARHGFKVERQPYAVQGRTCENLAAERPGTDLREEIVIVGAHYDTVPGSPGANDNGTGVAAALALAEVFSRAQPRRTLRLVFFANEEPPFFQTEEMGSLVYAMRCRERKEKVVAMFALETMGYFSDQKGSQSYPPPIGLLYPSTGNFIGFVGNLGSAGLVRSVVGAFRKHAAFPSEGAALPGVVPGVGWSDHWSFWKAGYKAVMVTDTAPFRYPHYHQATDTPERVDFHRLARVTAGLAKVIGDLAEGRL